MSSIPPDILYNRLRNRIIEHLELVASADEQLAYQRSVPIAQVSSELFNTWGDWVAGEAAIAEFTTPIFSPEEQAAVREFNSTLVAIARQVPQDLPPIAAFIGTPLWEQLSLSASKALSVFMVRGIGPEDGGAI